KSGEILGKHDGLALFTIGQRKGIRISSKEPYYVVAKNIRKNELTVGFKNELGKKNFYALKFNWISGEPPLNSFNAKVKIRYKSSLLEANIDPSKENSIQIELVKPVGDITPGQLAVVYQKEKVLGSGIISLNEEGE
ncbi:MAG: tRNA 2-thiouridine(34) synthase MnmA, partial [Anaerolineaceae bacterium]|nr:tRNA 2-thiouridine(34) synthase MnmA [Anaerolineaceae bacterium]